MRKRLAAGGDDADVGRRPEQRVGELRARAHHVLAVVQNQRAALCGFRCAQSVCGERLARLLAHARAPGRRRSGTSDGSRIGARSTNQTPSGYASIMSARDLQRQPRLAEAAHAQQRQQARFPSSALASRQLPLAPDERRELLRQVVRRRLERAQRREILPELRMQRAGRRARASTGPSAGRCPGRAARRRRAGARGPGRRRLRDSSIWPPCATLMIRAVRLTGLPK